MAFSAVNLSTLPAPQAIEPLDFETILARMLADLRERDPAYTAIVESDPAYKVLEVAAYRELLLRQRVNEAVLAVMPAFAIGSDLDHLGVFYETPRHPGEPDADFRRRILLAPEAFAAAGAHGAYMYHALAADPRVRHADVWHSGPGQVTVAIQSREGNGRASDDLVEAVRAHLSREDIKPLTDTLSVRSAVIVDYEISVTGYVLPGPAPATVRENMVQSLQAMALQRKTPARDVPLSAIAAAAHVGPVDRVVIHSPTADVATGRGEVPNLIALNVKVETYDG